MANGRNFNALLLTLRKKRLPAAAHGVVNKTLHSNQNIPNLVWALMILYFY